MYTPVLRTCTPSFLKDEKSQEIHLKKAKEGLKLAHRVLREKQTDLLILDEERVGAPEVKNKTKKREDEKGNSIGDLCVKRIKSR